MTGIELGPDYCVLVRARGRGALVEVTAVRVFEPGEWPADARSRAARLDEARRELGFPRHAIVVAWDLAAFGVSAGEEMLRAAGFAVDGVIAPSDALTLLARTRAHPDLQPPIAWLSINRHGAAIAVVRDGDLLYGREFAWRIRAPDERAQAHLLRRYLYVAQIVPEVRKALDVVGEQQNLAVATAVASGNIPDLRSFTMPLIEALDIEVETLDSLEGFQVSSELAATVAQAAPLIRLAGAAAAFGGVDRGLGAPLRWAGAAAALVLAAAAAWWAFSSWSEPPAPADASRRDRRPAAAAQNGRPAQRPGIPASGSTQAEPAAVKPGSEPAAEGPDLAASEPASQAPGVEIPATGPGVEIPAKGPDPGQTPVRFRAQTPSSSGQRGPPRRRTLRVPAKAAKGPDPGQAPVRFRAVTPDEPARPHATAGRPGARPVRGRGEAPPLPVVGGIMVSRTHRIAVIDGAVVGVGDRVNGRTVVAIESDAVVFRDASGEDIRVPVRSRGGA